MIDSRYCIILFAKSPLFWIWSRKVLNATFPVTHTNVWRCSIPRPFVSITPKWFETFPRIPILPVWEQRRPLKIPLQIWSKNWVTVTRFDVTIAWWIAALAAGRISSGHSISANFRTRGFRKSDGLIVNQNAGIPYRAIKPLIWDRIISFCECDSGTEKPIAVRSRKSLQIIGFWINCLLATAFAASCSCITVKEAISSLVELYFLRLTSKVFPRDDCLSCKTS